MRCKCHGTAIDPQLVGDPVDTLSGAVFDRKLEFRLAGPLDLSWYRYYNSGQCQRNFALGWGHTHDFDRTLSLHGERLAYEAPVGLTFEFSVPTGPGDEVLAHGFRLRWVSANCYWIARHAEPTMEFVFRSGQTRARLTRLFDGAHQIIFEYGPKNALERIVDSMGRKIQVAEDAGRLDRLTLVGGAETPDLLLISYHYDIAGNLVRTANAQGHGHAFAYDDDHRLLETTGRKGFRFRYKYDQAGRCKVAQGDKRLYGVALTYDVPGRLTHVLHADLGHWTYTFDRAGRLDRIVNPVGGSTTFVHDDVGRLVQEVDAYQNVTRIVLDEAGAAKARIGPMGQSSAVPNDPNAPRRFNHRMAANPAEYELGRLIDIRSVVLPDEKSEFPSDIPTSALTLVVSRDSRAKRAVRKSDPWVRPLGTNWWPAPQSGRVFDVFGNLTEQHDDFGHVRRWTYDASGNLRDFVDFDGDRWQFDCGSWHLLLRLTDPLGRDFQHEYGTHERPIACTDPGGTRSDYRYDTNEDLVEVRRHGVVRETYARDKVGNLVAKFASDGRELLRLEFGPGNLPVSRRLFSGDEHRFSYDPTGRVVGAETRTDTVARAYDAFGNLCLDTRNGRGMVNRFSNWGIPLESVLFDRFLVRFERPTTGKLAITDPAGATHHLRLLPHGMLERQFSQGCREVAQYDNRGRCLFKFVSYANGNVWTRRFSWSGEGRLQRVVDNQQGDVFHDYDAALRLQARRIGGRSEAYVMDAADNLLAQPGLSGVTLDSGNRLKTANGSRFSYNDRNDLGVRESALGPTRYFYDSCDQLIGIEMPTGHWTADYDALGRRVRKGWQGQTTEYHWNGDQLVAEVAGDGRLRLYVYADPLALTPFLFLDYASVDSDPGACRRYVVLADQIGAPCQIEDERGIAVWRARMQPFGQVEILDDAQIRFDLRFPGHQADPETGLHYNRFRYYDPLLGRYLQSDPWGITGGYNLYAYRTNPLLDVDTNGLGGQEKEDPEEKPTQKPKTGKPEEESTEPANKLPRMPGDEEMEALRNGLVQKTQAEAARLNDENVAGKGPVLTGVVDPRHPEDGPFFGSNQKGDKPENPTDLTKARMDAHEADLAAGKPVRPQDASRKEPADHSEVSAMDQALKNRESKTGQPATEADLAEMQAHNSNSKDSTMKKSPEEIANLEPGESPKRTVPAGQGCPPRCDHCQGITGPRDSGPGMTMIGPDGQPQPR